MSLERRVFKHSCAVKLMKLKVKKRFLFPDNYFDFASSVLFCEISMLDEFGIRSSRPY
jgi:hypothetical protein